MLLFVVGLHTCGRPVDCRLSQAGIIKTSRRSMFGDSVFGEMVIPGMVQQSCL